MIDFHESPQLLILKYHEPLREYALWSQGQCQRPRTFSCHQREINHTMAWSHQSNRRSLETEKRKVSQSKFTDHAVYRKHHSWARLLSQGVWNLFWRNHPGPTNYRDGFLVKWALPSHSGCFEDWLASELKGMTEKNHWLFFCWIFRLAELEALSHWAFWKTLRIFADCQ